MKKQALIWTYVGMALEIVSCGIPMIIYTTVGGSAGVTMAFIYLIPTLLSFIFGMMMVRSIGANKKKIWLGVMGILFCWAIGGIVYLIWNPENEDPSKAVAQNEANSRNIEKKLESKEDAPVKENVADELLKLKDADAITEEEYEEKKAELVKKL